MKSLPLKILAALALILPLSAADVLLTDATGAKIDGSNVTASVWRTALDLYSTAEAATAAQGAKADTALQPTGNGAALTFDASGMVGNLTTSDNTVQELAQVVDDLDYGGTITDTGDYYSIDTVDAALQEVGAELEDLPTTYLPLLGGTMAGSIDMDGNDITGINTFEVSGSVTTASMLFAEVAEPATPAAGNVIAFVEADGFVYGKNDAGTKTKLSNNDEILAIVVGDATSAITTGNGKGVPIRLPFAITITGVSASLKTVSSSGLPTFDINESGTTILSTKLTLDASELTSSTAATAAVVSDASIAAYAPITIDIDTAGTGAVGPVIYITYTR